MTPRPAELLLGRTLDGGWRVEERVERSPGSTGGCFSVSYRVRSESGMVAFLKALDFSQALRAPDPANALQALTEAYNFERDLLSKCRDRKMDRVVRIYAEGKIHVDESVAGVVQYLIFELGDRDVRLHLDFADNVDIAWKLRSLHHVATGLSQLHSAGIAQQDLKPSNVLVFDGKTSKVGDLGRAAYESQAGPWDGLQIAGDPAYAPPECLYGYVDPHWKTRRFGSDLYLLGSMAVFFFTGLATTAMLAHELHESHRWRDWGGTFDEALPYIRDAFGRVIGCFASQVAGARLRDDLVPVIEQLCDPDPRRRGLPAGIAGRSSRYSLERYVSKFDAMARRAELGIAGV